MEDAKNNSRRKEEGIPLHGYCFSCFVEVVVRSLYVMLSSCGGMVRVPNEAKRFRLCHLGHDDVLDMMHLCFRL